MKIALPTLVRDVRLTLDRNRNNADLLTVDLNTQMLDEAIARNIIDGVVIVLKQVDWTQLEMGATFQGDIHWMDQGSGYVVLPSDFIRLLAFKMSDWNYAVNIMDYETSSLYKRMHSPYKSLRGVAEHPLVFEVWHDEGKTLAFYSCNSEDAQIVRAEYVPLPCIADDAIEIPFLCYGACVNSIASLVAMERGATELASALQEKAKSLM